MMKVIQNRRLVPVAEKTQFLSPVQFGNWKKRTTLDALLLKVSLDPPDNAAKCSALINKNTKRSIKTTAGVTKHTYQHTKEYPMEGEGQGKLLLCQTGSSKAQH
eukprot:7943507-Ditylum_brightwellii.AAC.2